MESTSFNASWREADRVIVRGGAWTIRSITPHLDCLSLGLSGDDNVAATLIVPFDRPRPAARPGRGRCVNARRWLHVVRRAACDAQPLGGAIDPVSPSFDLLPYQMEPALACLREGAGRVLIADAVGLGKTVQAGLLLHSLAARQPSFRALVVTPAGLRRQWADELVSRFDLASIPADAEWLRRAVQQFPADVVPWSLPGVFVVSFDFLKRPEVLRPIENLAWDVLVVDEAHNLTTGTARRAAVQAAALRSMKVVLLTATPHAGDPHEYRALCSIGQAGEDDRIVVFRRTRADVGAGRPRRSSLLTVRPTGAERRLHRLTDRYTAALCRDARGRGDAARRLLAIVLKKRALSSAAAAGLSVRRRLGLLSGDVLPSQLFLPLDADDRIEDDVTDTALSAPGLTDVALEQRLLRELADAADAVGAGSKPLFLLRLLRRIREPAIVFTEYRDTLIRLAQVLTTAGHAVTLLHGGQSPAERESAQREFNSLGGVLLATDAASEGLNLHERCRLVVHYELPWSPARMEQRTGRVDRLGQRAVVHEILLVAGHAAERMVLGPLARRAAQAQRDVGPMAGALHRLAESAVGDAILDGTPLPSPPEQALEPPAFIDLRERGAAEAARLAVLRAWRARSFPAHRLDPGVVVTRVRGSREIGGAAVYRLTLSSPSGRAEHQELVAIRGGRPRTASEYREISPAVLARLHSHVRDLQRAHARVQRAAEMRARRLARLAVPASGAMVQVGLFDRRAVLSSAERTRVADELAELFESAAQRASAATELAPALELVAAIIG